MLVIEGDHVTAGREGHQVVGRPVIAHHGVWGYLRGTFVGRSCQYPEPDAESDSGRGGHPGQLASPYHPDNRLPVRPGTFVSLLVIHYPP
jgi:hypothetical protein